MSLEERKLLDLITDNEGYRQFAYSCTAGKQTIGIGFNLDDVGLSREESEAILRMRVDKLGLELGDKIENFYSFTFVRRAALCDMAYQLGINGLLGFKKSLAHMNSRNYGAAADEFLDSKWARQTPERAKKITDMIRTGEWPS